MSALNPGLAVKSEGLVVFVGELDVAVRVSRICSRFIMRTEFAWRGQMISAPSARYNCGTGFVAWPQAESFGDVLLDHPCDMVTEVRHRSVGDQVNEGTGRHRDGCR